MDFEEDQSASDIDTDKAIERVLVVFMVGLLLLYLFTGTLNGLEPVSIAMEIIMGVVGIRILSKKEGFIQQDYEFANSTQIEAPVGPCGNCAEDFRHPILSADGKYRCPKCAKPIGQAVEFLHS